MQNFGSCLENRSMNDSISILAYISQIKPNFLLQNELETLCLELYNCLKTTESTKMVETILTYLVHIEKQNYIILNTFKININDKWFFKLIVLASLKHCKEVFNKMDTTITVQEKYQILQESILTFRADKLEAILVLRLIDNLIKRNKCIIDSDLAYHLLLFSQQVAISPVEGYKNYAHNISKISLSVLNSKGTNIFMDFNLLPLRGIETLELIPYLKQVSRDEKVVSKLVMKVIQMFSNNIDNREGGFLYKSVLFEDFSYWKKVVWPQFMVKFQVIDFEGEFFQSLIKYWIPQCVSAYKLEFYTFTCSLPISTYLKGHILLEARRKGLIEEYNGGMINLLSSLFADDVMSNLALKIVSSYFKRNLYPCDVELKLVNLYLYGRMGPLDSEELKNLHRFLSQIGVVGSDLNNLEVQSLNQEKLLACYKNCTLDLFMFCLKSLKTSKKSIGAQILMLFWKFTNDESPYLLHYKYDKVSSVFYSSIFQRQIFDTKLIEEALLEMNGNISELTKLGQLVLPATKLYSGNYLLKFIDECTELNSIMAAESVKNVSTIIVFQNEPKENVSLLQNLFDAVSKHFQHFSPGLKCIFKGVLLFEAILVVSKDAHSQEACIFEGLDTYCFPVIADILENDIVGQIYQQEIKKNDSYAADQHYNLLCKIQKIMESLLNNVLQYIIQDHNIWLILDKPKIMNFLVQIIKTSNMRRPTTLSADVLKHIAKLITAEYQSDKVNAHFEIMKKINEGASYKLQLLHNTLQNLCEAASVQNLSIRRNPESRLIIHALCQSDTHLQKPILVQTLRHLLGILSNPRSSDSTVCSAMHCAEILISDNTLYDQTLRFVPGVILQCVDHFKNRNWIVRNANIQLARSLIERFMGVLIGRNNRPRSIEDLFCLFPQLITRFCQILAVRPLTDSAVIVMQLFSESQIKRQPCKSEKLEITRDIFFRLFIRLIKENCDHYGLFAVRAYTSLCLKEDIPNIIKDIIDFVIKNFTYIKQKHTIRNFVLLLHQLYDTFLSYIEDFPVKPNDYYVIHASFDKLSNFLNLFDTKQFDLILLKVLPIDEVLTVFKAQNFDISDYTQKVWQHNYIPLLLINTKADLLNGLLKEILFKDILDCVQVKILSILVDRYSKNHFSNDILEKISNTLLKKILIIDDSHQYLLLCYFKVIFLFFKCHKELKIGENCIKEMVNYYGEVKNIYKMFVFVLVLAQVGKKNDCDKKFIKTVIGCCQSVNLTNFEKAEIISEMLPYLYVTGCCNCDRYRIFKMAIFLLMDHGWCNFVSFITKSKISSPLIAVMNILDFNVLIKSFDSSEMAYKFVKEFYEFVVRKYAKSTKSKNTTYYVEERPIFVDRLFIDKIVLKFLRNFNRKYGSLEWLRYYESLQGDNKS